RADLLPLHRRQRLALPLLLRPGQGQGAGDTAGHLQGLGRDELLAAVPALLGARRPGSQSHQATSLSSRTNQPASPQAASAATFCSPYATRQDGAPAFAAARRPSTWWKCSRPRRNSTASARS